MESLAQEQDKLVLMGTIKPYKDQSLVARDSKENSKDKNKVKKNTEKAGPIFERMTKISCSYSLSMPHCFSYKTSDLNFEK